MVSFLKATAIVASLAVTAQAASDLKLCKLPNYNLQKAAVNHPELKDAINTVINQGVATWYTDRVSDEEHADFLNAIRTNCTADETMLISVYGLPQKDCADGYSAEGGNRNASMYKRWVQELADAVGTKKVIYIYEADALALTIDGKCGTKEGYIENIQTGIPILTKNANSKLYLDVGYWTLQWPALLTQIITNFKKVETAGKITGIAIGTSNYRPTTEMVGLCSNFSRELNSTKYHCVLDTSRNFMDTVPGTDWCNQLWAGVGHPATGDTGYASIDAFLWVKPVGESDGTCNGGPEAGQFWYKGFATWWNQGWFVKKEGMKTLPTTPPNTPTPTPAPGSGGLGNLSLCQLPNYNLTAAAQRHPELKTAIDTVLKQGVASWYTDRVSAKEHTDFLKAIKNTCKADETMLISVYGLPQKDCADGYSSSGGNRNAADYKKWVQDLADAVGTQKVIYIYEPDALALTIDGKCGTQQGYIENIRTGLPILTQNPNAKLYLDIGYWTLQWPALITQIITNFKKVEDAGKITGIAIGTSNYRPTSEMIGLCGNFTKQYGSKKYHCVLDTSRNYIQDVPGTDWCNQMWAGVGHPATGNTGYSSIDALLWIKPVGESDGTCNGGPTAGTFWYEGFAKWWNQGWFVKEEKMKTLPTTPPNTPVPTSTPAPTSSGGSSSSGNTPTDQPTVKPTDVPTQPPTTAPQDGAAMWGQCGGINWNGPKTCKEGRCVKLNDWYFQCQ